MIETIIEAESDLISDKPTEHKSKSLLSTDLTSTNQAQERSDMSFDRNKHEDSNAKEERLT